MVFAALLRYSIGAAWNSHGARMNPDLSALTGELYRNWERTTATFWDQVLDDPNFLNGMSGLAAANATAQRRMAEATNKTLETLHLPTREDITRVARLVGQVEDRLLAVEDQLHALTDSVAAAHKEALKARVEAAETRLALEERLAGIEALLANRPPPRRRAA